MGDFVAETELERVDEGRFRAVLSPSWMTWGPAGGYVSAVALRAAGAATSFVRPISYACQYLAMARFEAVELAVESWIAPNLDLYVRFHRDTRPHEWLYSAMRADLAEDGLIAAQGAVWSPGGKLLASGASQLFCAPRPERFR